jgi:large subunit ribosomal protein L19
MKGLQGILHQVEAKFLKNEKYDFRSGDNVKVHLKVKEGEKERIQIFEGTVIGRGKDGVRENFRVRRIASGVGVERVFLFNSPNIVKIQVTRRGTARKARLYYLKGKSGKASRIAERRYDAEAAKAQEGQQVGKPAEIATGSASVSKESR